MVGGDGGKGVAAVVASISGKRTAWAEMLEEQADEHIKSKE